MRHHVAMQQAGHRVRAGKLARETPRLSGEQLARSAERLGARVSRRVSRGCRAWHHRRAGRRLRSSVANGRPREAGPAGHTSPLARPVFPQKRRPFRRARGKFHFAPAKWPNLGARGRGKRAIDGDASAAPRCGCRQQAPTISNGWRREGERKASAMKPR